MRKRKKSAVLLATIIPQAKFDGKPFAYFLDKNDVEYRVEEDGTFVFASMVDRLNAATIWRTLTGSEVLGRFLNLN